MSTPYSDGPLDAPLCFIGEAPASWEMAKDKPFIGPAGKVLDQCLHQASLVRRGIGIENASRYPVKSGAELVTTKGVLTTKGEAAQKDLLSRLNKRSAKVYVPLGNTALAMLTGEYGITKFRGSPIAVGKNAIIPTFHPAQTLRGRGPYTNRYIIASDIQKAERHTHYNDQGRPHVPERELHINPTFRDAMDYLAELREKHKVYAFDIEIVNLQVSCIGFSHTPNYGMCIPFWGDSWSIDEEMFLWRAIAGVLEDRSCTAIAHNAMFDVSFLYLCNAILTRARVHDTMVMQRIRYPDFPARLDFVTSILTDEPYYKDDKQLWNKIDDDRDKFWRYNTKDACTTMEIYPQLFTDVYSTPDLRWTYENTMSLFEPCLYMMARGVQVERDELEEVKKNVLSQLEDKRTELNATADEPFNPTSAVQCIKYFYGIKGIKPYVNRKTSRPTCDDKALSRIIRRYNLPEARLVQEIRALDKLRGTYLDMEFDTDNRLRCTYDIRGTSTGRLSSKKTVFSTGLNMQNLHPQFKGFIVPG